MANTSTASSNRDLRGINNIEDRDPLPKRLRECKKDRVVVIEKNSALCENIGVAFIDLSIEKGKYKVYYLRIDNE